MKENTLLKEGDCCQEYYNIEIGHKAYHCSGEPKKYFYHPRKENRAHIEVRNCACPCHTGGKPVKKKKEDLVTLLSGLKKGEQIQLLIKQNKSNEEILLQVKTTINSIRWHRSKIK